MPAREDQEVRGVSRCQTQPQGNREGGTRTHQPPTHPPLIHPPTNIIGSYLSISCQLPPYLPPYLTLPYPNLPYLTLPYLFSPPPPPPSFYTLKMITGPPTRLPRRSRRSRHPPRSSPSIHQSSPCPGRDVRFPSHRCSNQRRVRICCQRGGRQRGMACGCWATVRAVERGGRCRS